MSLAAWIRPQPQRHPRARWQRFRASAPTDRDLVSRRRNTQQI